MRVLVRTRVRVNIRVRLRVRASEVGLGLHLAVDSHLPLRNDLQVVLEGRRLLVHHKGLLPQRSLPGIDDGTERVRRQLGAPPETEAQMETRGEVGGWVRVLAGGGVSGCRLQRVGLQAAARRVAGCSASGCSCEPHSMCDAWS